LAAGAVAFSPGGGFDPVPGSAVMMLTGGIEAADGKSYFDGTAIAAAERPGGSVLGACACSAHFGA